MKSDTIIAIIFGIVFVLSALKKLTQTQAEARKGGGAQGGAPPRPDAEAGRSEVEDFLRSLQESRRKQGQEQAPQRPMQGAQRQAVRAPARRPQEAPFWQGLPAQPANEEGPTTTLVRLDEPPLQPPAPAVRPTRARRRKQEDRAVETLVAKEPVKDTAPTVAKPAAAALPDLKKFNLRDAVIWSEILRPPLSLRGRAGRPPHTGRS